MRGVATFVKADSFCFTTSGLGCIVVTLENVRVLYSVIFGEVLRSCPAGNLLLHTLSIIYQEITTVILRQLHRDTWTALPLLVRLPGTLIMPAFGDLGSHVVERCGAELWILRTVSAFQERNTIAVQKLQSRGR